MALKLDSAFVCAAEPRALPDEVYVLDPLDDATEVVREIIELLGFSADRWTRRIDVRSADIDNAVAVPPSLDGRRRILVGADFIARLRETSQSAWYVRAILAHEVAHHLNDHLQTSRPEDRKVEELEADRLAGFVLFKMGADSSAMVQVFESLREGEGYPRRSARVAAARAGWDKARSQSEIPKMEATDRPQTARATVPACDRGKSGTREQILASRDEARYGIPTADLYLCNEGYVSGYSYSHRIPRWTLERLTPELLSDELQVVQREDKWREDHRVPKPYRAAPKDYAGSGFDRGHLVPPGNRRQSRRINHETFLLSNVTPQIGTLNRGPWRKLESAVRDLAKEEGYVLYVISGPLFYFGEPIQFIGIDTQVSIPHGFFKSILAERDDGTFHLWSFEMPNEGPFLEFQEYLRPTEQVEARAGLDLWDQLPEAAAWEKADVWASANSESPELESASGATTDLGVDESAEHLAREPTREPDLGALPVDGIFDRLSGLTWSSRDNGVDISQRDAAALCTEAGWRLPTLSELKGLHDTRAADHVIYPVRLDLELSGSFHWSSSEAAEALGAVSFESYSFPYRTGTMWAAERVDEMRALCVRARAE